MTTPELVGILVENGAWGLVVILGFAVRALDARNAACDEARLADQRRHFEQLLARERECGATVAAMGETLRRALDVVEGRRA